MLSKYQSSIPYSMLTKSSIYQKMENIFRIIWATSSLQDLFIFTKCAIPFFLSHEIRWNDQLVGAGKYGALAETQNSAAAGRFSSDHWDRRICKWPRRYLSMKLDNIACLSYKYLMLKMKMLLTRVSSFHQPVSVLLAGDQHEAVLPDSFAGYIVSLTRSSLKITGQRFHSRLPWTRSWMNEWSKELCVHSPVPPAIQRSSDYQILRRSIIIPVKRDHKSQTYTYRLHLTGNIVAMKNGLIEFLIVYIKLQVK